ncbi:MAG: DUF2130 domain-containing protein [Bacilli bacterium]|nr:DUF2130 domain-containing protein [Bacilli bacterium]
MAQIKCPNCGEIIQLDKGSYDALLNAIEKEEIRNQVKEQTSLKEAAIKAEYDLRIQKEKEASNKESSDLKHQIEILQKQIEANQSTTKLEVEKALAKAKEDLNKKDIELAQIKAESVAKLNEETLKIKSEVDKLKAELKLQEQTLKHQNEKEINDKANEIASLKNQLIQKDQQNEIDTKNLKEKFEIELKTKDQEIVFYRDLKARMSTKMLGETLEQHCYASYGLIRPTLPRATFEKDNDAKTGSKGDFIFRETTEEGAELISIMFEMKNEADQTATKHKNEDFFKELDKDRKEKNCEYAVLVSTLEIDNEEYNAGIVDVSNKYEKMYVVRPQCFIPIITLLRGAALNAARYKDELVIARSQSVDVTNFENNLNDFKEKFAYNYNIASKKFQDAIEEIDKTITHLTKVKEGLTSAERNLRLANDKAQDVTIKRLTKNSPSVKAKFEALENESDE